MTKYSPGKGTNTRTKATHRIYNIAEQSNIDKIAQLRQDKAELLEALKSSELIVVREAERVAEAHRNAGHPKSLNVTALVLEKIQAAIAKAGKES